VKAQHNLLLNHLLLHLELRMLMLQDPLKIHSMRRLWILMGIK
jgi:hypothetical protein